MANANNQARPLIELKKLSKTYITGEVAVHALREVDLSIKEGDFVMIMGASGSGKSTMMNLIGCLDTPTGGEFHFDGTDIRSFTSDQFAEFRNKKIGFVFQGFNLLSRTTAFDNVLLPTYYRNDHPRAYWKERAHEMLRLVGLADREGHTSNQLSGGQQQRVAIARALITNPKLLLADEPTGNLDSATSVEIMNLFQELNKQGVTIVLVTHEPDIATYGKRVITMKDGEIISDIRQEPRNGEEA